MLGKHINRSCNKLAAVTKTLWGMYLLYTHSCDPFSDD